MHFKKYYFAVNLLLFSMHSFAQIEPNCYDFSDAGFIAGRCSATSNSASGKRTDQKIYLGALWSFDGKTSKVPDFVVGYRSTDIKSKDRVSGGDLSLRFNNMGRVGLEGVRLSFISGKRDVLGNLGLGYSFNQNSPLITGAIQLSHFRGGSDFFVNNKKFVPYVELNSLKSIKSTRSGTSCAGNLKTINGIGPDDLRPGVWLFLPVYQGAEGVGGQTCFEEVENIESDIRLKHDIHELAVLENGLKIYSFKYKSRAGDFVGVMAQDLLSIPKWSKAVVQREDGHYLVNYGALGIRMTTLEDWNKSGKSAVLRSHNDLKS